MEKKGSSLENFFRYMVIGFLISCIKTDYKSLTPQEILEILFLTFMYNIIIGIGVGLSWMFGIDLYYFIKKNGVKNENRGSYRVVYS